MHDVKALRKRIKEVVKFVWENDVEYDYRWEMILGEAENEDEIWYGTAIN